MLSTSHGRDLFSRVLFGAQVSLVIGFAVTLGSTILGAVSGLLAGYYRHVDAILMRLLDGLMAFPRYFWLSPWSPPRVRVSATRSSRSSLSTGRAPRASCASTLQIRARPFEEAAVAIGATDSTILGRYIFVYALTPLTVQATFVYAKRFWPMPG